MIAALTVTALLLAQDTDTDDAKARALAQQIGGLREDFTDEQFLARPILKELLILDRGATAALEDVLRHSQDWSARLTAAYLLIQIEEQWSFRELWKLETHPFVRCFLFTEIHGEEEVSGREKLREQLAEDVRERLLGLADTPTNLSEAEEALRMPRLLRDLILPHNDDGSAQNETGRAWTVLSRNGASALPHLIDAYHAAPSDDVRWNILTALSFDLGSVDMGDGRAGRYRQDMKSWARVKPYLAGVLRLAETGACSQSTSMREATLRLLYCLAFALDVLGEDPEPPLRLLRQMAANDANEGTRDAAAYRLSQWDKHLKERAERASSPENGGRTATPGSVVPQPSPVPTSTPHNGTPREDEASRGIYLLVGLVALAAGLAGTALALRRKRPAAP